MVSGSHYQLSVHQIELLSQYTVLPGKQMTHVKFYSCPARSYCQLVIFRTERLVHLRMRLNIKPLGLPFPVVQFFSSIKCRSCHHSQAFIVGSYRQRPDGCTLGQCKRDQTTCICSRRRTIHHAPAKSIDPGAICNWTIPCVRSMSCSRDAPATYRTATRPRQQCIPAT